MLQLLKSTLGERCGDGKLCRSRCALPRLAGMGEPEPAPRTIQTWQDAEHNAAAWMRHWGYTDARAVPGGPDAGIDVRSAGAVAQVKWQSVAVGRPMLQQLVGANDRPEAKLMFFTASNYTAAAVEYADSRHIALFTYGPWGRMEPTNSEARLLVAAAERQRTERLETTGTPSRPRPVAAKATKSEIDSANQATGCGVIFILAPFAGLLGMGENDTPWWQDLLAFPLILLLSWAIAAALFAYGKSMRSGS